jgi:hypothetical protein
MCALTFQCRVPLSSSVKPFGNLGGLTPSLTLQSGHGIPGAPQPQAYSPSHAIWEWASQTQRNPKQRLQIKLFVIDPTLTRTSLLASSKARALALYSLFNGSIQRRLGTLACLPG